MKFVTLTFHPQAWINDYAVPVDPEGPVTFEVEPEAVRGIEPETFEADDLRFHNNAPAWIREWSGPFEITWETEQDGK